MSTKPKTIFSKVCKEHRIRSENKHNHVILIIQKFTAVRYLIHNCLSFGGCLCDNWKPRFLFQLIFN